MNPPIWYPNIDFYINDRMFEILLTEIESEPIRILLRIYRNENVGLNLLLGLETDAINYERCLAKVLKRGRYFKLVHLSSGSIRLCQTLVPSAITNRIFPHLTYDSVIGIVIDAGKKIGINPLKITDLKKDKNPHYISKLIQSLPSKRLQLFNRVFSKIHLAIYSGAMKKLSAEERAFYAVVEYWIRKEKLGCSPGKSFQILHPHEEWQPCCDQQKLYPSPEHFYSFEHLSNLFRCPSELLSSLVDYDSLPLLIGYDDRMNSFIESRFKAGMK